MTSINRDGHVRDKGVVTKLDRDTHMGFKMKLLLHDMSMQEAFEAFAIEVAAGKAYALRIIERRKLMQIKDELSKVGLSRDGTYYMKARRLSELDNETLYNLINEKDGEEDVEDR